MLGNVGFTQQLGIHSVGYTPYNQIMKLRNKPPEAYKAETLTDRSEVWSFACLAFGMPAKPCTNLSSLVVPRDPHGRDAVHGASE